MKKKLSKKSVELSMNTVIIATLCIIVLIVLVVIFRTQMGNIAKSFTGISEEGGKKAEEATWSLDDLFGCKEGTEKCRGDKKWKCSDDKWVPTEAPCKQETEPEAKK